MRRPAVSAIARKGWEDVGSDLEYGTQTLMYRCVYPPKRFLVPRYAKLGLHRYNLLHGKKLKLSSVEKFVQRGCSACTYSINLTAKDPETPGSLLPFQSRVHELDSYELMLKCDIGRPVGDIKKTNRGKFFEKFMPELPPENPFEDDTGRFYLLNKSELSENDDWIRMYLDLVVGTVHRDLIKHGQDTLEIRQVAMEIPVDLEPPFNRGLDAYDATFYINYIDGFELRVGKDVDRVAIVRRILDVESEILRISGCTQSSLTLKPSKGSAAAVEGLLHKTGSIYLHESD